MSPKDQALSKIPDARRWVSAAIHAFNNVIGFSGKRSEIDQLREFKAMKTHFHVSLGPPPGILRTLLGMLPFVEDDPTLAILKDIRLKYFDIMRVFGKANFLDAPAEGEGKNATAFVPKDRDGTLRITPNYMKVGHLNQVLVLIHEAAHFLGDEFQEWAYRDRTGEEDPNRYINLPVQLAIRNADSYAYFALQMAVGIDRVLELDE